MENTTQTRQNVVLASIGRAAHSQEQETLPRATIMDPFKFMPRPRSLDGTWEMAASLMSDT